MMTSKVRSVATTVLVLGFVSGCKAKTSTPSNDLTIATQGGDLAVSGNDLAPADMVGSASNDMAGGNCNALANSAPVVQQTVVAQPMPTASTGGTIQPGTYYLTDSKIYQGAPPGVTPVQIQATQLVSGSTVQTVQHITGSPNSLYSTRTYGTAGTTLTITFTCGGTGTAMLGYDATSTQYTTYNDSAKTVNVWTLH